MRTNQALLLLATIARIEGRWTEAVDASRGYLASSPSSQHAEIAQHHLIECLLRGKLDGADEEMSKYIERHPNGARAEEVRKWQRARSSSR
jgi:lipopolysaccharide biosynthesis regulator YciM